jgi:transcriptional regulator with XRE-family HTH domain
MTDANYDATNFRFASITLRAVLLRSLHDGENTYNSWNEQQSQIRLALDKSMATKTQKVPGSRSPNDIDRLVGKKLRQLRLDAGLTLQDLAQQIGISHQQLQKYETGTNRISVGMLPGIAEALGAELIEFFENAAMGSSAKKSKADQLRAECETWLRRTKSEDALRGMLRVLKALAG